MSATHIHQNYSQLFYMMHTKKLQVVKTHRTVIHRK